MPNRIIKESIRTSKKVNQLSDFEFRVWLYLVTYVDDYGRGSADPELLKGICFPRRKSVTEAQIVKALDNLANTGMIVLYEADEESFFYFPNWSKHQQIRSKKSKFPEPETIISNQMISDDIKCPRNPIQSNTNTNTNRNTNTNVQRESDTGYEAEFADAWSLYPKKQGKENAYKSYIKARKDGVSKDTIFYGIQAYLNYIKLEKVEDKYIKMGSTWFNQRCWEDDYSVKRKPTTLDIADSIDLSDF